MGDNSNDSREQQPRGPKKPKNLSSPNARPLGRPRHHRESERESQRPLQSGVSEGEPNDKAHQKDFGTIRYNGAHTPPIQASHAHTTAEKDDQPDMIDVVRRRTSSPRPQQPLSSPNVLSPPRFLTPQERNRAHQAQEARERKEWAELQARRAEEKREARARETPEEREKREQKERDYQKNRNMGDGAAAGIVDAPVWDNSA